MYRVSIEL